MGRLHRRDHLGLELLDHLLRDDAVGDEAGGVQRPHGLVRVDRLDHQRLRVGGLVLLVVPEAAVADEVDDHVVVEAPPERHREPDRRDRRLGIVGVDVHDRDVVALREVARVARRAALGGIGREADLVVRDQVQRAAGRVGRERAQVERLRDDPLAGERGVAVDQDRHRDARVVEPGAARPVGLEGARGALDDRVGGLEVARVRGERDRDLPRPGRPLRPGAEVVLDVAGAALGIGRDRLERALALELAQDRLVRAADGVREHVEPAAVRHPDHDLVGSVLGRELDRLVEHGDHCVEPLERELLLAEERPAQVGLHPLDLREAPEQGTALVRLERLAIAARLDRLPEPHALLVVGDVLDLVGDRARVRLLQLRQRVGEGLGGDVHPQHRRGDPRLELGRELRDQRHRVERRVAGRLGAERVEARCEVADHAVGLHERHRGRDPAEELRVRPGRRSRGRGGAGAGADRRRGRGRRLDGRAAVSSVLEQAREARERLDERGVPVLEQRPPFGRDRAGIAQVLLEQQARVARVQAVDVRSAHGVCCSSRATRESAS